MARILLIGVGSTAEAAFDSLIERFEVIGIVRPVDPLHPDDRLSARARRAGVPVFTDISPRSIRRAIADARPDCVVISSYGRLLDRETIAACPFVNVHYGPLPRYRGMAPVNWAILNRERYTAMTVHTVVEGMDAGRILHQERVDVSERDTVADLYDRLNDAQRQHLGVAVAKFLGGDAGVPQADADATYGCNRLPRDGEIDWNASTHDVDALVRALVAPFPGAFTFLRGQKLSVWRAAPSPAAARYEGRVPGRVVAVSAAEGYVDVLTGDGVLRLFEVQLEGGMRVSPASIIRSVRTTLGLCSDDLLERVRTLESQVAELTRMLNACTTETRAL